MKLQKPKEYHAGIVNVLNVGQHCVELIKITNEITTLSISIIDKSGSTGKCLKIKYCLD
jgi:hypothetical protein